MTSYTQEESDKIVAFLKHWAEVLKTTNKKQGDEYLVTYGKRDTKYYCCLGVFGEDCLGIKSEYLTGIGLIDLHDTLFTSETKVIKQFFTQPMSTNERVMLTEDFFVHLNDIVGLSFKEISDVITNLIEGYDEHKDLNIIVSKINEEYKKRSYENEAN